MMESAEQFAQLITDDSIYKAEKEVFRRARQLTRKINANARDMDPIEAYTYFKEILEVIENELKKWANRFSPAQWLWYLRRIPESVLSGKLPSTFTYDISLAEIYSGYSDGIYHGKHNIGNVITFPATEDNVSHVLKFCRMVRQVSRIHTNLRYAGKGVGFRFVDPDDFLPHPDVLDDIEEAIDFFDQRTETNSVYSSRAGTIVMEQAENWDANTSQILLVSRLHLPRVGPNLWQVIHQETSPQQILYRFIPFSVELDKFADLTNKDEISRLGWPSEDALCLIALQRMMIHMMTRSQGIHINVPLVGYSVHSYSNLCIDELDVYRRMLGGLEGAFPNRQFPQSMKEVLDHAMILTGQAHPLKPGPVIRKSGDLIFLDWYSMTHQLDYLLEFPKVEGEAANERAVHFELSVQALINKTLWQPNPHLLGLRGRHLKYPEKEQDIVITDIDAIGEKDDKLLLVSCKANIFSAEYDIGDYRSVRNQASNLQTYVDEWQRKKQLFLDHMFGNNYDFRSYSEIIAVVCTPRPVYVPIGQATAYETGGLRKAVSVAELEQWLNGNNS